MGQKSQKG